MIPVYDVGHVVGQLWVCSVAVVALLRDASPAPGPLAAVLAVNVRVQAGDDAVTVLETQ